MTKFYSGFPEADSFNHQLFIQYHQFDYVGLSVPTSHMSLTLYILFGLPFVGARCRTEHAHTSLVILSN